MPAFLILSWSTRDEIEDGKKKKLPLVFAVYKNNRCQVPILAGARAGIFVNGPRK